MAPLRKLRTILGLRKRSFRDKWPWPGLDIGRHTYGVKPSTIFGFQEGMTISVGSFCSIGKEVLLLARAEHPLECASTFPLKSFAKTNEELRSKGPIVIGNDVWIGQRAIVMSGVTIGNGAVIGAGAVVTKSVAPYEIVAGNPARHIRFRCSPEVVAAMHQIAWWDWPDDQINENLQLFDLPADLFVKHCLSPR
jgi:acetyltransferase-like isoleucine patch superfamily enzyme